MAIRTRRNSVGAASGRLPLVLLMLASDSITGLWRAKPRGVVGAFGSLAIGLRPSMVVCGQESDECGFIPVGVGFAAVTTGLGAMLGRLLPAWHPVWPRSDRP